MDYSKMSTSKLLFDELPGLCRCGIDCTDSILREQILAEIDRRIPVPTAPKLDGWQPIDTAPHDGSLVLVAVDRYPDFARWNKRTDHWETTVRSITPTHWMPLPEVPR